MLALLPGTSGNATGGLRPHHHHRHGRAPDKYRELLVLVCFFSDFRQ